MFSLIAGSSAATCWRASSILYSIGTFRWAASRTSWTAVRAW